MINIQTIPMRKERAQTVFDAFAKTAAAYPGRPVLNVLPATAQVYGIDAGEINYGQALSDIEARAEQFLAVGFNVGMRVALLLENRPDFFLIWLALNKIGVSVVPINPDLRAAELEYLIGHAEPALIITIAARRAEMVGAALAAGIDLQVITAQEAPIIAPRENAVVCADCAGESDENREAALLYTSGTTGSPKGCVLPNAYFLVAGRWYENLGGIAQLNHDGERMITPLPVYHMNAMAYSFMAMVAVGGALTAVDRFHPKTWWANVAASGATCLHYLGVMPSILMELPAQPSDRAHTIRFGFGAGVDPKLQKNFEMRFGFPLVEAWAMTETGAGAVVAAHTPDRLIGQACFGRAGPDVEIRIVDGNGAEVGENAPGELLVRRAGADKKYGFFAQYYKNEAATKEAWQGGWFHTGDIVRRDHDGNMFFVDRKKNVIRRSGENIAAVEVESILMRHPAVQMAAVAAVPDAIRGDEVFACLKVAEPSAELALEITQWGLGQMAYYKVPGYIVFVEAVPLTTTQKIQRAELKRLASELLTAPQTHVMTGLKKRQTT